MDIHDYTRCEKDEGQNMKIMDNDIRQVEDVRFADS